MKKGRIVVSPNPYRDRGLAVAMKAKELLEADGHEVVLSPVFVEVPAESNLIPLEKAAQGARLVVSIGGDGTFLHAARRVMALGIPMLGVNMGTKGFMASLEPEELEYVRAAARGDFRESRRMLLDVELLRGDDEPYRDVALNDAVVKSDVSCIGLEVRADGQVITSFAGDGVIIATPTGSTAYSMSAGGPLVEPEAKNIIVTPICAHSMAARSFVLAPGRKVTVEPERLRGRRAVLTVDGLEGVPLASGDEIRIERSGTELIMVDMGIRSFYDTAFEKLTQYN